MDLWATRPTLQPVSAEPSKDLGGDRLWSADCQPNQLLAQPCSDPPPWIFRAATDRFDRIHPNLLGQARVDGVSAEVLVRHRQLRCEGETICPAHSDFLAWCFDLPSVVSTIESRQTKIFGLMTKAWLASALLALQTLYCSLDILYLFHSQPFTMV